MFFASTQVYFDKKDKELSPEYRGRTISLFVNGDGKVSAGGKELTGYDLEFAKKHGAKPESLPCAFCLY